ncbi:proteoglycan 4-like isoform X2 [Pristis pectinata]|nr:proteoglycan 4-like isoform X2 [Pristis pectinata]
MKYDVFCFKGTDDKSCASENSPSTVSTAPTHPGVTGNNNLTALGMRMAMGLPIITVPLEEDPGVTSAEGRGTFPGTAVGAERLPSPSAPGLVEPEPTGPWLTPNVWSLEALTESAPTVEQPARPTSTKAAGFTRKSSTLPARAEPLLTSHPVSPGLGKDTTEVADSSGSPGGREPFTKSAGQNPLTLEDHRTGHQSGMDFPAIRSTVLPFPTSLLPDNGLQVAATGAELQANPVTEIPLTTGVQGTNSEPDVDLTTVGSTAPPAPPTSVSSPTLNEAEGRRVYTEPVGEVPWSLEFTNPELISDTASTTTDGTSLPSLPSMLLDNSLRYNTKAPKARDESNSLHSHSAPGDPESVSGVTTSQVPESTGALTTVGMLHDGMPQTPMTPNPPELAEEVVSSTGILGTEILLNHQAVGIPGGTGVLSSSPSPTDLSVESGSTPEGSGPVDHPLDLATVTVSGTMWRPSDSPSPEPRHVGSGITPEILDLFPTEVFLDYSTDLGHEIGPAISVSPEPAFFFGESGSIPDALSSETQETATTSSSEFIISTELATGPTSRPPEVSTSKRTFAPPVRSTPQAGELDLTWSDNPPDHPWAVPLPSVTTQELVTSALLPSPEMPSVGLADTTEERGEEAHPTEPPPRTEVQPKHYNPGLTDTPRAYTTPAFGPTTSPLTTTSRVHQVSLFTVGQQQNAQPNITKASDRIIRNERLDTQPEGTAVGEKPPEAPLDWLIVAAIIVSLLIILLGGVMIIYSKRLCGRKKSLMITRQGEDGVASMEKGAANGRGGDESKHGEPKADAKGSDEWIQLIDKENVEVTPESAEATKLMRREESGELSDIEVTATTQEQENRS